MKTTLKVSLLLNLILLGGLIFLWSNQRKEGAAALPARPKAEAPAPVATVSAPPVVRAEPKPFRWSQLVSSNDYRVFVANLRAIGCPEPTVEDIVRGDAERAYFAKRTELHVDGSKPGPWSAQAQMQMVACLLGQAPAAAREVAADTASPSPAGGHNHQPPEDSPVSMPLVLQDIDLSALGLDDEQMQMVANVRQNFVEQIGGTNQDPNDPAYLERWQQAQPAADSMFRVTLGTNFWKYQMMAGNQEAPQD